MNQSLLKVGLCMDGSRIAGRGMMLHHFGGATQLKRIWLYPLSVSLDAKELSAAPVGAPHML